VTPSQASDPTEILSGRPSPTLPAEWPAPSGQGRLVCLEDPHRGAVATNTARVLGIDPGGTTGLALYDGRRWLVGETPSLVQLHAVLKLWRPSVVVAEQFIPEPNRPVARDALWAEGVIRLWRMGHTGDFIKLIWSNRGNVMSLCTDEMLHANDLWIKSMRHGRDAIRHVLHYLVTKEHDSRWIEFTKEI